MKLWYNYTMGEARSLQITESMVQGGIESPELLARPVYKDYNSVKKLLEISSEQSQNFKAQYIKFATKLVVQKFSGQENEDLVNLVTNSLNEMLSGDPKNLSIEEISAEIYQQILQAADDIYINLWRILNKTEIVLNTQNFENLFSTLEQNFQPQQN